MYQCKYSGEDKPLSGGTDVSTGGFKRFKSKKKEEIFNGIHSGGGKPLSGGTNVSTGGFKRFKSKKKEYGSCRKHSIGTE